MAWLGSSTGLFGGFFGLIVPQLAPVRMENSRPVQLSDLRISDHQAALETVETALVALRHHRVPATLANWCWVQ